MHLPHGFISSVSHMSHPCSIYIHISYGFGPPCLIYIIFSHDACLKPLFVSHAILPVSHAFLIRIPRLCLTCILSVAHAFVSRVPHQCPIHVSPVSHLSISYRLCLICVPGVSRLSHSYSTRTSSRPSHTGDHRKNVGGICRLPLIARTIVLGRGVQLRHFLEAKSKIELNYGGKTNAEKA